MIDGIAKETVFVLRTRKLLSVVHKFQYRNLPEGLLKKKIIHREIMNI